MKWMITRIVDERSSGLCEAIEEKALSEGGLTFPFSIKGIIYTERTLHEALERHGDYYTHAFHSHCRSKLYPVTDNNPILRLRKLVFPKESVVAYEKRQVDTPLEELQLDETELVTGALSHLAELEMQEDQSIPSQSKVGYFFGKMKKGIQGAFGFIGRMFRR